MTLRHAILGLLLALAVNARADDPAPAVPAVRAITDVAYYTGDDADQVRHTLDLYVPTGTAPAGGWPVLMFVHGGSWKSGNKNLYGYLGRSLARRGLLFVAINYRLSPAVKHPAHIEDVARAAAWLKANAARHGGDPGNLFVCGHSAGGHLCTLLAFDATHLARHGMTPADLRGVIPISGVFEIDASRWYDRAFPRDGRPQASPMTHVAAAGPPVLVLVGDKDMRGLIRQARTFEKALIARRATVERLEVPARNHFTIIMLAGFHTDPVNQAITRFVKLHRKARPATTPATGDDETR